MNNLKNQDTMKTGDRENTRKRKISNGDDLHLNKISHAINHREDNFVDVNGMNLNLELSYDKPKTPNLLPQSTPFSIHSPPGVEFIPQSRHHETLMSFPHLPRTVSELTTNPPLPIHLPPISPPNPPNTRQDPPKVTGRKIRVRPPPCEENKTFPPPYPWAANKRATVHSLEELTARKIQIITGLVQCKRCEKQYEIGFNLREKFIEVGSYILNNKESMHDRAPSVWMSPILPTCKFCEQENSVKPVISEKKKSINWLFLLLGQMLGCCTLGQLKYFCKHTENHRTGAKDRVLYLTYLGLCKQLQPHGPFDR